MLQQLVAYPMEPMGVNSAVKIPEKLREKIKWNSEQGRFRGLGDYHMLHSLLYTLSFLPNIHRPGAQATLFPCRQNAGFIHFFVDRIKDFFQAIYRPLFFIFQQ